MSPLEHYFENLLVYGKDVSGEPNKNALSKEVQEAVEICADYVKFNSLWRKEDPTTKNDLGVDVPDNNVGNIDCISREQAKAAIRDKFKDLPSRVEINTILNELPPATPQEPRKGHWIKIGDRGFGFSDIVICKCSECEYQTEFVGKFDGHNLVIDAERADNYCSNCGSDNREVKE